MHGGFYTACIGRIPYHASLRGAKRRYSANVITKDDPGIIEARFFVLEHAPQ